MSQEFPTAYLDITQVTTQAFGYAQPPQMSTAILDFTRVITRASRTHLVTSEQNLNTQNIQKNAIRTKIQSANVRGNFYQATKRHLDSS